MANDLKRRYTFTCVCYTARTMRKFEYVFNNLIKKKRRRRREGKELKKIKT